MHRASASSGPALEPASWSRSPTPEWNGALHPLAPRKDLELWQSWTRLARERGAPLFLEPAFFALERTLLSGGEPLVVTGFRDGSASSCVAGALPLVRHGRVLESLRSMHAPRFDYVGDPEALAGIWRSLRADRTWDTLVLRGVPAGSPLTHRLPSLALRDLHFTAARPGSRSPYLALPGFEARLPAKQRQNLRRCRKKLGVIELERITAFSRPALEAAFAIEALAWKGVAGTSIAASPALRRFYTALARLGARRGQLALSFLEVEGRRVAFAFALEHGGVLYPLKVGYDPALSDASPGHLLFEELARDGERRGLLELDFLGQADEWKRRWTHQTREHVSLVLYRPSPRGTAALIGRELVKPRVPAGWTELADRATAELTRRRLACQRRDLIGRYRPGERAVGRLRAGLGLRTGLRRVVRPGPTPAAAATPARLGAPSRFEPGQWVRVRPPAEVRATLDRNHKLRGLKFVPAQWVTAGQVFQVDRPVRRLMDDRGHLRPVSGTVLLRGVTCAVGGDRLGCGRHCPLMFRDQWLEPAAPATARATEPPALRWATVRSLDQIRATLDGSGRTDGLHFMPEMARFTGRRLPVLQQLGRVFELDAWRATPAPVYLLDGARCTGAILGDDGPCDRSCALLWHARWIDIECATTHRVG